MKNTEDELEKEFAKNRKVKEYEIRGTNKYKLIHMIEEGENDYAISAKIVIPKNSKMIEKSKKYNKSPITQVLEEIEKEHRILLKEGKTDNKLYFNDKE